MSEHEARETIDQQDEDRERADDVSARDDEPDVEGHIFDTPQIRSPRD